LIGVAEKIHQGKEILMRRINRKVRKKKTLKEIKQNIRKRMLELQKYSHLSNAISQKKKDK